MLSSSIPEQASIARGLWLGAVIIAGLTALRLWPSEAPAPTQTPGLCHSVVEWRSAAGPAQARCADEVQAVNPSCSVRHLDAVTVTADDCAVDPGGMTGRMRLAIGEAMDLNRASVAELQLLHGIGPSRAEAIVDDRATRGAFPSVDSLSRVPGIGPATVARLRPSLIVGFAP